MDAVVGGGGWSVHLAGVEHGLFGAVVEQRDTFHREPPLTRRLVEIVGHLQSDTRGTRGNSQSGLYIQIYRVQRDFENCSIKHHKLDIVQLTV